MVMSLVIVGTNMGLSVIQLNAGLNSLIGGANGVNMELVIIAVYLVMTIYFACSGVHGAMGALSNVNALMYVAVILFVLFCGGANRLLGLYSTTVSNFIMQYIPLVGFADPIQQTGWQEANSMFFYSWNAMPGLLAAFFYASVSYGRKLKEFVLVNIMVPTVFMTFWYVFVGGTASLQLMYDAVSKAFTNGLLHSEKPWCKLDKVKWICPVPGYDRHFKVTESFGVEMISVPMTADGPDMDQVEALIKDPAVKGMWNVPKYSNPEGVIYSAATIDRLAKMKPAAPDFMLMWDNAYCIHEFDCDYVEFPDIISLCAKYGNADMVYEFASTSKVTFPGAGVGVMASSADNIAYFSKLINIQTIGFDKINQLRHVLFLKDKAHTLALMKQHAAILAPKFHAVLDALDKEIAPLGIAGYKRPVGGYFVSVDVMPGCAKRTLALCKEAGVTMTGAGATFPYGKDPRDSNLRIAPTFPSVDEIKLSSEVISVCAKLAAVRALLSK